MIMMCDAMARPGGKQRNDLEQRGRVNVRGNESEAKEMERLTHWLTSDTMQRMHAVRSFVSAAVKVVIFGSGAEGDFLLDVSGSLGCGWLAVSRSRLVDGHQEIESGMCWSCDTHWI